MFEKLRKEYPVFEYLGFEVFDDGGYIGIKYSFRQSESIAFTPSWTLPFAYQKYLDKKPFYDALAFNLGLVEAVSYWKACCSPVFRIFAEITDEQIDFFKKLWWNGLGEFFYVNKIKTDCESFVSFECVKGKAFACPKTDEKSLSGCLIPVGGGKDSAVTLKRLEDRKSASLCFMINPSVPALKTAEIAHLNSVCATRRLDRKIVELNAKGFLNGHTPFSAIVAFSSFMCACLANKKYIVLSNESSANDVYVKGTAVNHQYSKSVEFENDFRDYAEKFLGGGAEYFSILRPLNEWGIVKEFVKSPEFFPVFLSCNLGAKEGKWCCNCSKCLFTYIMLSAFIPEAELIKIFGENLLDKPDMLKFFDGLVNPDADKPFECIGTRAEINAALTLAVKKAKGRLPLLLQKYKDEYFDESFDFTAVDNYYDEKNNIPKSFSYIPKIADFFQDKSVAILGFGREGRSTLEFVKEYALPKSVTVIDKKQQSIDGVYGENYLEGLEKYDIIMKAPGIALLDLVSDAVKQKVTSQTDLFLRFCPCRVIGITGTKGKSTTSTATYYALNRLGFPVRLVGNIGIPVFSDLKNINEKTVVVYELSCHQLEYVKASPSTAVLLNIFSDHLDHYTSQKAYENAKRNIYRYQKKDNVLICAEKVDCASKQLFPAECLDENMVKTHLIGQHNKYNLSVAALAAQTVGADIKKALAVLEDFEGLEHRIEYFATINGVKYYNDSISTIPEATLGALDGIGDVSTLIVGGMDRGISYDELVKKLSQSKTENIIFMYQSGKRIFNMMQKEKCKPSVFYVDNLSEAVSLAKEITTHGSCLLSPAAASYGDFENFEHRGRAFKELVKGENK